MSNGDYAKPVKLSIVIPCFDEELTLSKCVDKVLSIADDKLSLEVIIVDDHSSDNSYSIALKLEKKHPEITVLRHEKNCGKGAALRSGFQKATGDFVAIQDADLEYDPMDLKRLLTPLLNSDADVVLGSRFLSTGAHRVLYFWHYLGNRFLTFISNMFTDLNLTDMETCYKVFRREIIQNIQIKENRFGFEPEIVAKAAHMRLRIYEMGISYRGRTYEEGKKIRTKDGLRAIYCIFRYNAYRAPIPVQFILYLFIGGVAAVVNLFVFLALFSTGLGVTISAPSAFIIAAIVNYLLCIAILFRHRSRWRSATELMMYFMVVGIVALLDLQITRFFLVLGAPPAASKAVATVLSLIFNFIGRRFFVFPESSSGPWRPQDIASSDE
jgi:glycosyltransferase involved in cell wall biosynthesis